MFNVGVDFSEEAANAAGIITTATMLMNTKYADKENYIPPEKVNKNREKSGKPLLTRCSIIKISKRFSQNKSGGGHSSPKPHWRRGHSRTLRNGMQIPIEPVIVNFDGENIPPKGTYIA